jgi:hypothetical protein
VGISRKNALARINSLINRIVEHLSFLQDEIFSIAYHHWRHEILNWIAEVEFLARVVGRRTASEVMSHVTKWKEQIAAADERRARGED